MANSAELNDDEVLVNAIKAKEMLGSPSDTTFWRYYHDPYFAWLQMPKPVSTGRTRLWRKSDIVAVQARMAAGKPK